MIRVELRRGGGWVIAIGAAALTVLVAQGGMYAGVWLWSQAAHGVLYSAILVGPLAAAAGAWWSGRDRRAGIGAYLDAHARPPASRWAARMGALGTWLLAGQLVGVAIVFVPTALNATGGEPWWAPVIAVLAFVQACALGGFILGTTRLPSWVAAGLAAFAAYVLAGFASYASADASVAQRLVASLVPIDYGLWSFTTGLRDRTEVLVPITQLALAATLAGGLLARRHAGRGVTIATVVASAVLAAGLTASVADPQGPAVWDDRAADEQYRDALQAGRRPDAQPSVTCHSNGTVEVCMTTMWAPLRDEVTRAITPTLKPIVEATGTPIRATQVLANPSPLPRWSDGTVPFAVPLGGSTARPFETSTLVAASVVGTGCGPGGSLLGDSIRPNEPESMGFSGPTSPGLAQRAVAEWLVQQAGQTWTYGPPLDRGSAPDGPQSFAARLAEATTSVPRDRWVMWLSEHLAQLRDCQLTPSDLPVDVEAS